VVDNLAALYAWILKHENTSWADNFVVLNDALESWEQMQGASMKSTFALDETYFNEDLIERVSHDVIF
jgi:hypothetical protein